MVSTISRLESGFIKAKKTWVDIVETIHDIVYKIEENGISKKIIINISAGIPLFKTDKVMLEQIVSNIINNAVIYSYPHSIIKISVSDGIQPVSIPGDEQQKSGTQYPGSLDNAGKMDFPGELDRDKLQQITNIVTTEQMLLTQLNTLRIIIEDNGPGFPEDELPFIFDKFYRLKNTKTGGTGLGLSIVKGFAEALNGQVRIENLAGGGGRFTILIPCETSYLKVANE